MEEKKNNGIGNEELSFLTDEEALTEIDFGSFLDETAKGTDVLTVSTRILKELKKALRTSLKVSMRAL